MKQPAQTFDTFFTTMHPRALSQAQRQINQKTVAEEIVQEAFHSVWQRWDDLEKPEHYLRSIISNRCRDELRKKQTRRKNWQYLLPKKPVEQQYMKDALSHVQPKRRTALFLKFYEDRTMKEIAEAMDIPQGTAKSLIHRGIADLRFAMS